MADVVVTGYAIRFPLVGNVLAFAHYVAGLSRLGHRVVYLEESGWDQPCYDPRTGEHGVDPAHGITTVREVLGRLGAASTPVWYFDRSTSAWHGTDELEVRHALAGCDLLLNLGGVCQLDEFARCATTALVDMDPGFTQAGRFGAPYLSSYDVLFTYGTNIDHPDCLIPDVGGHTWHPTVPPVIVDHWQAIAGDTKRPATPSRPYVFSTVANLDAYGGITVGGRTYGQKEPELDRLGDAALLVSAVTGGSGRLELALSGADAPAADGLIDRGWTVVDAHARSSEAGSYERYVLASAGEFSVAKEAYVGLRTGWFSDRSVCYLASGRPVIVQDTGFDFERFRGPDGGLLTWRSPQDAVTAVVDVIGDYERHAAAAHDWAAAVFAHDVVLPSLLDVALANRQSDPVG